MGSCSSFEISEGFLELVGAVKRPMFHSSKVTSAMAVDSFPAETVCVVESRGFGWRRESPGGLEVLCKVLDEFELRGWLWDPARDRGSLLLGRSRILGTTRDVLHNSQLRCSERLFRVMKPALELQAAPREARRPTLTAGG